MAISMDDIKKLSPKAKAMIIVVAIIIVGYFDWFYFLSAVVDKRTSLNQKLEELQGQVKEKEKNVLQFDKYKADVAALRDNYNIALQKLPVQREIPGLFHSVAQAGKDAGIDFLLFEPKAAIPKTMDKQEPKVSALLKPSDQKQSDPQKAADTKPGDGKKPPQPQPDPFYEEIPVNVTVIGNFQNIVYFFEKVAKLPRIVNISDISMGDRKDVKGKGHVINTSCTIKTYMFVDKKEPVSEKTK
ncbi:MAG: type 4a pilus biogenesis protein PilO [Smithellaceae bacterium]